VIRADRLVPDRERALVVGTRSLELSSPLQQDRERRQRRRGLGMLGSERALVDLDGPLIQRARAVEVSHVV
jgi:hypothetical protein